MKIFVTVDLYLSQNRTIIWSSNISDINLINYNKTIKKNVSEELVTQVISDLKTINDPDEDNIQSSSFNTTFVLTVPSIVLSASSIIVSLKAFKKTKAIKRKTSNNENLHEDLRAIIMSQFVSVNSKSRNEWISKLETSLSDRATDVRGFLLNRKIRREGLIDSSLR